MHRDVHAVAVRGAGPLSGRDELDRLIRLDDYCLPEILAPPAQPDHPIVLGPFRERVVCLMVAIKTAAAADELFERPLHLGGPARFAAQVVVSGEDNVVF